MAKWIVVQGEQGTPVHIVPAQSIRVMLSRERSSVFFFGTEVKFSMAAGGSLIEVESLGEARERAQLLVSGPIQPPDPH